LYAKWVTPGGIITMEAALLLFALGTLLLLGMGKIEIEGFGFRMTGRKLPLEESLPEKSFGKQNDELSVDLLAEKSDCSEKLETE
jgi:hypothetical protein